MMEKAINILFKYAKNMKPKGNEYIGLDINLKTIFVIDSYCYKYILLKKEDVSIINEVFHENLIFNFEMLKEYSDVMKEHWYIPNIGLTGNPNNTIEYFNSYKYHRDIFNKWEAFKYILSNTISTNNIDLNARPDFWEIISSKSAEGAKPFIIDDSHIIFLFSGVLPILKSDTVDLDVFDLPNKTFITQFYIHKKNYDVNSCMICLKV